jgi:hypothetical protein
VAEEIVNVRFRRLIELFTMPRARVPRTIIGFFVICAAAAFLPGYRREIGPAPWEKPAISMAVNADDFLARTEPTTDPYIYLVNGLLVAKNEAIQQHYLYFWPPGMAVTIAAVKRFFSLRAYPRKMIWLSVILWTMALSSVFLLFPRPKPALRFFALSSIWLLPHFRDFIFGFGSILSESFSTAFFVIGCSFLWAAIRERRLRDFVFAGLAFGLAANYRMYFLMSMRVVLACFLLFAIIDAIRSRTLRPLAGPTLAMMFFLATLLPWSMYKLDREETIDWSTAPPEYSYGRLWNPEAEKVWWAHTANAQCQADPQLCEVIWSNREKLTGEDYLRLAIMTTVSHPLSVARVKLAKLSYLWFGRSWRELIASPLAMLEGTLFIIAGVIGSFFLGRRAIRSRDKADLIACGLIIVFLSYNVALFAFLHFEWRFSTALRCAAFLLPWFATAQRREQPWAEESRQIGSADSATPAKSPT